MLVVGLEEPVQVITLRSISLVLGIEPWDVVNLVVWHREELVVGVLDAHLDLVAIEVLGREHLVVDLLPPLAANTLRYSYLVLIGMHARACRQQQRGNNGEKGHKPYAWMPHIIKYSCRHSSTAPR